MDVGHEETARMEKLKAAAPDKCHVEVARSRPVGIKRRLVFPALAGHRAAAQNHRGAGRHDSAISLQNASYRSRSPPKASRITLSRISASEGAP